MNADTERYGRRMIPRQALPHYAVRTLRITARSSRLRLHATFLAKSQEDCILLPFRILHQIIDLSWSMITTLWYIEAPSMLCLCGLNFKIIDPFHIRLIDHS